MSDPALEKILNRLTLVSEDTNRSFLSMESDYNDLRVSIASLKDARYKPYLTTMGAILALFVAGVSYVYQSEKHITGIMFAVSQNISEIRSQERINHAAITTLNQRLSDRTATMGHRWDVHIADHESSDRGMKLLAEQVLKNSGGK